MNAQNSLTKGRAHGFVSVYLAIVIIAALAAIAGTYLLLGSTAAIETKIRGLAEIVAEFLAICFFVNLWSGLRAEKNAVQPEDAAENSLQRLDDANEFFAGSINPNDMFRLAASHVRKLVPFRSCALLCWDESLSHLWVQAVCNGDLERVDGHAFESDADATGKCLANRSVEIASNGTVAIPLFNGAEPFGVLELRRETGDQAADVTLYDAIGTRVAPLILSSIAFERTASQALVDDTTDLPNERALYLILENHIAESQRKRDERPLTLLAIDVDSFDGINQSYGHAAGDRVLGHVARIVRDTLRNMDFLARCRDDEFLAVLPTASRQVAQEVAARIGSAFFETPLKISEQVTIEVTLNIGSATFGEDGETPEQLIAAARLRKQAAKSDEPMKVLWFPPNGQADDSVDLRG